MWRSEQENLFFKSIKSHCGWYISEYQPPNPGYPFGTLQLTFLADPPLEKVVREMEAILDHWTFLYPVSCITYGFRLR